MPMSLLARRIWIPLSIPFVLLFVGMVGYRLIEGPTWSWMDALYMAAITLTTVGYGETHPLSQPGRVFTIVYLFTGVFLLFYTATETIRAIVSGEFRVVLGKDRRYRVLLQLQDHIIICGLGRMGRLICQEFERSGTPYVIIDRDVSVFQDQTMKHGIPVHGDSTSDEVLLNAGVKRARALITVLPSDADNLYITLSARVLNESLCIIARAEEEAAEEKLKRVGANQVVAPYVIGGHKVVQAVLRPTVVHFLEQAVVRREEDDFQIEEILVEVGSELCGKSLRECQLHQRLGIMVLSIKGPEGKMLYNPQGDAVIEGGNVLIAVGQRAKLRELERIVRKPGTNE
jgi:voltage-gated potassium channel